MSVPLSDAQLAATARRIAAAMFAGLMPGETGSNMANEIAERVTAPYVEAVEQLRAELADGHYDSACIAVEERDRLRNAWFEVREALIHGTDTRTVLDLMDRHDRAAVARQAADTASEPVVPPCRYGHDRAQHDPDQCRVCPSDDERSWRHPYTPEES